MKDSDRLVSILTSGHISPRRQNGLVAMGACPGRYTHSVGFFTSGNALGDISVLAVTDQKTAVSLFRFFGPCYLISETSSKLFVKMRTVVCNLV